MPNQPIETERLILRPVVDADVDGMFELDSNPEVHKYLGNNPITTKCFFRTFSWSVSNRFI